MGKIYLSAITPVFYQSKMGQDGSLNLSSLAGEIDWGAAVELIKFEGFYMFGGRSETGEASNQLLIFLVAEDHERGGAKFRIIRPKT